ncbi:MAG: hypothetical protein H6672_21185 [Anaerolineaceae bacterium]|nr:hypothetical protein [Anaerolineaceae bacterium]
MDIGLILLTVCGLALVCVGTFLVVAFIVARTTGVRLWSAFSGIGGIFGVLSAGEDDNEPELVTRSTTRRERRSRGDFRARAQSLDFDSAVARQVENPSPPSPTAQSTDFSPRTPRTRFSTTLPDSQPLRHHDEDNEDEIFGGFLDEDGDGTIDF